MKSKNLIHKTIITNLIKVRISKRYSQERIADTLDIKQSSYNKMEAGTTRISSEQLGILAVFYQVDICDFYRQNVDFSSARIPLVEEYEKIKAELAHQKTYNNILLLRNEELEIKLKAMHL